MKSIIRYLRIYKEVLRVNTNLILVYRFNILIYVLATLSWAVFAVIAVLLYSYQVPSVIGWTKNELLTLTGVFSVVTGISYTLFLVNFIELPFKINSGEFDAILLKPIDSQFTSTLIRFSHANIARFFVGVMILFFTLKSDPPQPLVLLKFLFLLLAAIVILYSIWMILVTLNFYTKRLDNIIEFLLELFDQTSRTPSDAFRVASSWAFNFLLPLFMVVSFPTKAVWGKLSTELTLTTFAAAVILFILSRKFWQYSLKHYSSAGG